MEINVISRQFQVWLSIDYRLTDTSRYQLTNWHRLVTIDRVVFRWSTFARTESIHVFIKCFKNVRRTLSLWSAIVLSLPLCMPQSCPISSLPSDQHQLGVARASSFHRLLEGDLFDCDVPTENFERVSYRWKASFSSPKSTRTFSN